jgi:hypothetical protein
VLVGAAVWAVHPGNRGFRKGSAITTFSQTLTLVAGLLCLGKRVSYRRLRKEFGLDDETLEWKAVLRFPPLVARGVPIAEMYSRKFCKEYRCDDCRRYHTDSAAWRQHIAPAGGDLWPGRFPGAAALSAEKRSRHPIDGDPHHLLTGRTASGCSRVS